MGRLYDSTPYQESITPEPASTPLILRTETIMTFENYPSPQPGDKEMWRGWSNKLRGNYVHLYLPSSSDQSSIMSQGTLNSGTSNQHPPTGTLNSGTSNQYPPQVCGAALAL